MASRSRLLLLALGLLLPARLLAAENAAGPDIPDPAWRQGPIRYILVVKEDQAYKAFKTDEERAAFIEKFWAALDPTPGTDDNERRAEFWKRVEVTNREFQEGMAPGWKSDRGKVYILLGPPDDRERMGPAEIWRYQVLPGAGAAPGVMFRFGRNSQGEYRMGVHEYVGRGALRYWDPTAETDGPAAGETFLAVRSENSTPQIIKGRIRMTEFPVADVKAEFATAPLDCRLRYDFYRVKRSSTRVVVTLALPKGQFRGAGGEFEAPDVTLSVAVDDAKKGKPVGRFSAPMRLAGGASPAMERPLVLQGAFIIEPGTYKAVFNILDRRSHRGVTRVETIEAPDFGRGLALSSIALGRLRGEPLAAGGAALIPEPDTAFHEGETILFAYEVYNAEHKGGATPNLDVTYEFFFETEKGQSQAAKPVILRHQTSDSLGYSLPLSGWPAGVFRVRVQVTDIRTGARAEGEGRFRVEDSPCCSGAT